ncbi:MAG: universal stress protein [Ginsengibacter sp.]
MKRILVPTDFSPNAQSALRMAVDIASRSKGTIILFHVYIPIESPFVDTKIKRNQHNTETETIIMKQLQRLKKKVLKEVSNVNISTIVGRSPLINNILGFAEHNDIDLIVMGTKGTSGIRKVLVGSVAAKIVQKADIPVLLIPEEYEQTELDLIVFASDLHLSDQQALSRTLTFSKLYNVTVTVVHLLDPDISEKKSLKEKNDFDSYAYYMQREFNRDNLKFQLLETSPGLDKIETLYKEIPYNILVMVRRKKSFFQKIFSGSLTQTTACMAKRPLLIIPAIGKPIEKETKEKDNTNHILNKIIVKKLNYESKK